VTAEAIQAKADLEALKFSTAKQIREQLDAARKAAEDQGDDADDFEAAILELVTEDAG
jgi:hypothetical protein